MKGAVGIDIAIVTGASSGIGREFALQLDRLRKYDEIWLIARRQERLKTLAAKLQSPARALPLDLALPESIERVRGLLECERPTIRALVNAGGIGCLSPLEEASLDLYRRMTDLNCTALLSLCHLASPYLPAGAQVYNAGSLSAFQPVPYMRAYVAGKAFVLSFSRALGREWRRRGVSVLRVCPGWVRTSFWTPPLTAAPSPASTASARPNAPFAVRCGIRTKARASPSAASLPMCRPSLA